MSLFYKCNTKNKLSKLVKKGKMAYQSGLGRGLSAGFKFSNKAIDRECSFHRKVASNFDLIQVL